MDRSRFTRVAPGDSYTIPEGATVEEIIADIRDRRDAELLTLRHECATLRAALAVGGSGQP